MTHPHDVFARLRPISVAGTIKVLDIGTVRSFLEPRTVIGARGREHRRYQERFTLNGRNISADDLLARLEQSYQNQQGEQHD